MPNDTLQNTLESLSEKYHDMAIMVMVWTARSQGHHIVNSMIDGVFVRSYVHNAQHILYKRPDIAVEILEGKLTIPEGWKKMKGIKG